MSLASRTVIGCLLLSTACAVGPKYRRPETNAPEAYRSEVPQTEPKSLADMGWWELYQDPVLTGLIKETLSNNLDLRIAVARVEEARARHGAALAGIAPVVEGVLDTSARPASEGLALDPGTGRLVSYKAGSGSTYTGGLTVSWEIDLFGRIRRSSQAALADLLSTEEARRAAVSALVAQVASDYFQLRSLLEQKVITERTIQADQKSLDLVRELGRGGVASGTEEAQALGQLASVQAQLPAIIRQIAEVENELSGLRGRAPEAIALPDEARGMPLPPVIPAGLPSQLLERRPDVRQAEQDLIAATARVGVAKASTFPFPLLSLTGFAGTMSTVLADLFRGKTDGIFSWGPGVGWPLLDVPGRYNVRAAKWQMEQAALSYRSTVLTALAEVADSLVTYQTLQSQIEAQTRQVEAGQTYLRLTDKRYRGGVSSYLEVLDAQRQLYAAEIGLAQGKLAQLQSVVQLYKALGGGWTPQPASAQTQESSS
ncbi:MAG: efflux transporter outer membrane subunit [Acidobacteriota bacterium]